MAMVELRGVRKSYGSGKAATEVIHGIDCTIRDGEFIVLVGPSGCGKSTLLRMVAGLETISAGEIAIGGRVVNNLEPKDRDIAMVFQNYALYPHMSVMDNMAYGLKIRGIPKSEIAARVARAAGMLELEPYLARKPRELSGGQRQRVAMGRAIVRDPAVFLFDEPLSNLDAKLRVQTRMELQKLHREFGITSMYVTHDQVEAMTLGERMLVMNGGVAEQIGVPMDVYARPASTFVATFIGSPSMNLLRGTCAGNTFHPEQPDAPGIALQATPPRSGALTLGIRPEHLLPASAGQAMLSINVQLVEVLGADSYVYGTLGAPGGPLLVARLREGQRATIGAALPLELDQQHLHWFDAGSGKRLP
jgi:sn-glycerol 3-phosphate transport system ATP-binding protein